ncbi:MAG: hypothetical protein KC492_07685 [Myxococcales bacterium]|nr:hypothetical protein [Myxococcales bacterium]
MRGTNGGDWLSQFPVPRSIASQDSTPGWLKSIVPLAGSLLVHGLLAVPLVLISFLPRAEAKAPYDAWSGETFEVAMAGEPLANAAAGGGEGAPAQPQEATQATEASGLLAAEAAPAEAGESPSITTGCCRRRRAPPAPESR